MCEAGIDILAATAATIAAWLLALSSGEVRPDIGIETAKVITGPDCSVATIVGPADGLDDGSRDGKLDGFPTG